eukprot:TRINITY_DN1140_c0_g1_i1.p1 TRINITY_DN1140_c0_g1~~TRINITY_DN1140_c0_g1_i1.p1  ORF type:complete len:1231 (-),score=336.40 TRINITY_DN1140_c0_g1_i1:37-3357(-)
MNELPPRKDKRALYCEGYVAQGILKGGWMEKKRSRVPAAVALVFPLDDKKTKEAEICSCLDLIRPQLRSRNIKPVIILVHNFAQEIIDDRVTSLRRRADLDPLQVVATTVKRINTDINGCAIAIEKGLFEIANLHYREEAKRIKVLLKNAPRSSAVALSARLNIKIAYMHEFRNDTAKAIKYYQRAFGYLRDLKGLEEKRLEQNITLSEIETVADYVNYKIVFLYVSTNNLPQCEEAVQQFQRHITLFKSAIAAREIEFEHWAWLSRQYLALGELLAKGAPQPFQRGVLHPGFYFKAAAHYTLQRRKNALRQCEPMRGTPMLQAAASELSKSLLRPPLAAQQFVGQTGRKPEEREKDVYRLYAAELNVEHGVMALRLLSDALMYYKQTPNTEKEQCAIQYQQCMLYHQARNWEEAKQLCDIIAPQYRREQWWELLTQVLLISRECVLNLRLIAEFLATSFELLYPHMPLSPEDKRVIFSDIQRILKLQETGVSSPHMFGKPLLDFPFPVVPQELALTTPLVLTNDLRNPLLSIQLFFERGASPVLDPVCFTVVFKWLFPVSITFSSLRVTFNDPKYDRIVVHDNHVVHSAEAKLPQQAEPISGSLQFSPLTPVKYNFLVVPSEVISLECKSVVLELGNFPPAVSGAVGSTPSPSCVRFTWPVSDWNLDVLRNSQNSPSVRILKHESHLKVLVTHAPPALFGELYEVRIQLINAEENEVESGLLTVEITCPRETSMYLDSEGTNELKNGGTISFTQLAPMSVWDTTVYINCRHIADRILTVKVDYASMGGYRTCTSHQETFAVQHPFNFKFSYFDAETLAPLLCNATPQAISPASSGKQATVSAYFAQNVQTCLALGRPFMVSVTAHPTTPYPLVLHSISLAQDDKKEQDVTFVATSNSQSSAQITLRKDQNHVSWFTVIAKSKLPGPKISSLGGAPQLLKGWLGTAAVVFSREGATKHCIAYTPLPKVDVVRLAYATDYKISSNVGVVGSALQADVLISNFTLCPQEFTVSVLESPAFLVSGPTCIRSLWVPPRGTSSMRLSVVPLASGAQALPVALAVPRCLLELPPGAPPLSSSHAVFASGAAPALVRTVFVRPNTELPHIYHR